MYLDTIKLRQIFQLIEYLGTDSLGIQVCENSVMQVS